MAHSSTAASSLALALALALAAAPAFAGEPSGVSGPESPFALDAGADATVVVAATAFWLLPELFMDDLAPGRCAPCDPGEVNALDRSVIGYDSSGARIASDVGLVALPALAGLGALLDVPGHGWSAALEDVVLVAESVAVSSAVNQVFKQSAHRPRPYMYDADLAAEHDGGRGDFVSFYSNHTAVAFSAATSFATVFALRRPDSTARFVVWAVGLTAASTVGLCRVFGGVHFWTDVIAGAVMGGGIGALVPALHLRRGRRPGSGPVARVAAGPGGAAVFVWF